MTGDMMDRGREAPRTWQPGEVFVADHADDFLRSSLEIYRAGTGAVKDGLLRVSAAGEGNHFHVAIGQGDHFFILRGCLEQRGRSANSLDWSGGAFFKPNWATGEVEVTDKSGTLGAIPHDKILSVKAALQEHLKLYLQK